MRRRASKREGEAGEKGKEHSERMSMLLVATRRRRRGRHRRLLYSNLIHLCLSSGIVIPPLLCCCPFFHLQMGIRSGREGGRASSIRLLFFASIPKDSFSLSLGRPIALFPSLMFRDRPGTPCNTDMTSKIVWDLASSHNFTPVPQGTRVWLGRGWI